MLSTSPRLLVAIAVLTSLTLGGCPLTVEDRAPARLGMEGLAPSETIHARVSDGGDFSLRGGLQITQTEVEPRVQLSLTGVQRNGDLFHFGMTIVLSREEAIRLGRGEEIVPNSDFLVGYPVRGGGIARPVLGIRLTVLPGRIMDFDMRMGASIPLSGTPESLTPESATAQILGSVVLSCSVLGGTVVATGPGGMTVRGLVEDPMYSTEFCRSTIREFGLSSLVQ